MPIEFYTIEHAEEDMIVIIYAEEGTDFLEEYATFLRGIGEYSDDDYLQECQRDFDTRK